MTFQAKLDNPESRAFWVSIMRAAQRADAIPDWQKGVLGEPARIEITELLDVDTPSVPPAEPGRGSE